MLMAWKIDGSVVLTCYISCMNKAMIISLLVWSHWTLEDWWISYNGSCYWSLLVRTCDIQNLSDMESRNICSLATFVQEVSQRNPLRTALTGASQCLSEKSFTPPLPTERCYISFTSSSYYTYVAVAKCSCSGWREGMKSLQIVSNSDYGLKNAVFCQLIEWK